MWDDDGKRAGRSRKSTGRGTVLYMDTRRRAGGRSPWAQSLGWLASALVLISVICILAVFGGRWIARAVFSENPRFSIRHFEIQSDGTLPADRVLLYSKVREGDNLYAVDLRKVRDEILGVPIVESVLIQRKLPDTLRIRVTERVPLARVAVEGLPEMAVDPSGMVLGPAYASPALPRIEDERMETLRPGTRIQRPPMQDALALLDTCGRTRLGNIVRIVRIRLEDDDRMILELEQGDRVLFPRIGMEIKLRRLVSILKAIQDRGMRKPGQTLEIDMTTESNWPVSGLLN